MGLSGAAGGRDEDPTKLRGSAKLPTNRRTVRTAGSTAVSYGDVGSGGDFAGNREYRTRVRRNRFVRLVPDCWVSERNGGWLRI